MSKTLKWLIPVFISVFFLGCAFVLIAALDEFARIPFYVTLPVAACLVNGCALLLLWRSSAPSDLAGRIYARFTSGAHTFSEPGIAGFVTSRPDDDPPSRMRPTAERFIRTQSREVLEAVAKIHSVAWFPGKHRQPATGYAGDGDRS